MARWMRAGPLIAVLACTADRKAAQGYYTAYRLAASFLAYLGNTLE